MRLRRAIATPSVELSNDKCLRLGGIALLVLSTLYYEQVFVKPLTVTSAKLFLESLVLTSLTWEMCRAILVWSRRRFPRLDQFRTRMGLVILTCWFASSLLDALDMLVVNATGFLPTYSLASIMNAIPGGLATSLIIMGTHESFYYFQRTHLAEKEAEQLKKENLQTQLDSLKQQVNPHFLFNSLNTLSYLIGEDAQKAEVFLNEMCKVYRHLLHSNEYELISLATELQFIKSYFHLLKTRYGSCLWLNLEIAPEFECWLIPSLTLQLLVENAVKHNIIHKDQPLVIEISTQKTGWLTVKNNLQAKDEYIPSNKIGLKNILKKFELLKKPPVEIEQTADEFIVRLPLIAVEREVHASQNAE